MATSILCCCVYFIAGCILAGMMDFENDEYLMFLFICIWPAFIAGMLVIVLAKPLIRLGRFVRNKFINLIKKEKKIC